MKDRFYNTIIQEDMKFLFGNSIIDWGRLKDKTVLVTGGYGMLPSYMVYFLCYLNYRKIPVQIVVVGRSKEKAENRFGSLLRESYFHFVEGDICEPLKQLENYRFDYIIHGASPASSQFYGVNPVGVIKPNILGTMRILEMAKRDKSLGVLYFSSGEIYGSLEKEIIEENDSGYINPMDVRSCYGESKRMGENLCKCYQHQFGVPAMVVRPSHTYGPTMDLKEDNRVFSEFVSNIVNGQNIVVKSDGSARRNFCYIADAVSGYFKVLLDGAPGEAYNVANMDGAKTIKELAELLIGLYPEKHLTAIFRKREGNYLENQYKIHPIHDTGKLQSMGWKCYFGVSEGFKRTIESFL